VKIIHSLSGQEIKNVSHEDRVLCALADTHARPLTSDTDGNKMIGPINAMLIVKELAKQGYAVREIEKI
jgi:hypothetical protein